MHCIKDPKAKLKAYCEGIKFAMHVFLVFVIISVSRKDKTKLCINTHLETSNSRGAAIIK